jgi:drug/metabolite transporter (DMT)-like permease
MAPWIAVELAVYPKFDLRPAGIMAVLYSAIGSLLLAYAGWSYVVKRLGAVRAGVTMHLMPVFGVILSAIFLAEYPRWFHFAGIVLILAGVGLSQLRPAR